MNNKGLTLVELITTFALTAVIIVVLMNIVLLIRNIYSKTNVKTELYINQSNLSNALNSKINNDNIDSYEECDDTSFCYIFNLVDGESIKLVVSEKQIKFGDYIYKLSNKSSVVNPTFTKEYEEVSNKTKNNSFIVIKIPIICELYPNIDFGINLIYQYNANKIVL